MFIVEPAQEQKQKREQIVDSILSAPACENDDDDDDGNNNK